MREGYLNALAARTLSAPPLLRPVTPSRFEPETGRQEVLEIVEPASDVPSPEQAAVPPPPRQPDRQERPADEPLLAPVEPDMPFRATAQPVRPEYAHAEAEPAAQQDPALSIATLARAVAAGQDDAMRSAGRGMAARAGGLDAKPAHADTSAARRDPGSAPMRAGGPTGHAWEAQELPPPVVVHIGRIDVRAAEPPRATVVPRPPLVQAGRSLADHLVARDRELP